MCCCSCVVTYGLIYNHLLYSTNLPRRVGVCIVPDWCLPQHCHSHTHGLINCIELYTVNIPHVFEFAFYQHMIKTQSSKLFNIQRLHLEDLAAECETYK